MERTESVGEERTVPTPEVLEKPVRRRFTVEYKTRILAEADACAEPGMLGELLRREGLYSSYLTTWRRQRDDLNTKVAEISKAAAEVKPALATLDTNPADPAANLAVGRYYYCLMKGDWAKGVSMLALSSDPTIKVLAEKELQGVTAANDQVALADGWWALAENETGTAKEQLQAHAAGWYKQALPQLGGLVKAKVEKRLNEAPAVGEISFKPTIPPTPKRERLDPTSVRLLRTLEHDDAARSIAFSPDSSTLASGGYDTKVRLWNVATGQIQRTLSGHRYWILCVRFSPDGSTLASGSMDRTTRLWDVTSGQLRKILKANNRVCAVAFSPDGSTLASGGYDTAVRLWDVKTGIVRRTLQGHAAVVGSVAFSPDGSMLASAGGDKTIRLWGVESGRHRTTLTGHEAGVKCVFHPNLPIIASASSDGTVRLWDSVSGQLRETVDAKSRSVYDVAFSPDGSILATVGEAGMNLWSVSRQGRCSARHTPVGEQGKVLCMAFSPDGSMLASGHPDKTIKLWGRSARSGDTTGKEPVPSSGGGSRPPKELSIDLGNGVKMEFVLIPAGEFMMGSSEAERKIALAQETAAWAKEKIPTEGPQHRVKITKPFYLGKYEVTQAQWQAVMGNNPSKYKAPTNPVE